MVGLLDDGKLAYRRVDGHRRIRVADLLEFRQKDAAYRKSVLDELTVQAEKHGLGYWRSLSTSTSAW